jgi:hypothetical protein
MLIKTPNSYVQNTNNMEYELYTAALDPLWDEVLRCLVEKPKRARFCYKFDALVCALRSDPTLTSPLDLETLGQRLQRPFEYGAKRCTLLGLVVFYRLPEVVAILLRCGINPHAGDVWSSSDGRNAYTANEYATMLLRRDPTKKSLELQFIRSLFAAAKGEVEPLPIPRGRNTDDVIMVTALGFAARVGYPHAVLYLVEMQAWDPMRSYRHLTPLVLALLRIEFLLSNNHDGKEEELSHALHMVQTLLVQRFGCKVHAGTLAKLPRTNAFLLGMPELREQMLIASES